MPTYEVLLTHSFIVTIQAESAKDATKLSEFFITYADGSLREDREKHKFEIVEIEMTQNDVFEVNQLEEEAD